MEAAVERIRIIRRSLRCFVLGWLSLIPIFGLALGVLAISLHFRVWRDEGCGWNPARRYLATGFCLAWLGCLLSLLSLAFLGVMLIRVYDF
jgi:hypothetical protein